MGGRGTGHLPHPKGPTFYKGFTGGGQIPQHNQTSKPTKTLKSKKSRHLVYKLVGLRRLFRFSTPYSKVSQDSTTYCNKPAIKQLFRQINLKALYSPSKPFPQNLYPTTKKHLFAVCKIIVDYGDVLWYRIGVCYVLPLQCFKIAL